MICFRCEFSKLFTVDNVIVIVDCGEKVLKNCDADMLIVVIDARYKKNVARGRKNDFIIVVWSPEY